jgi:hypothetical protein
MRTREAHHPIRTRHIVIAAAACSLLIAACSSSTTSTPAASGQGSSQPNTAQLAQDAAAFTDCMRAHGVAGLVDPGPAGLKGELAPGTQRSPAFVAALPACSHLLPQGGPSDSTDHSHAKMAAALAFARCIRSHGFPSFPDPTTTGQLTHEMVAAAGINLHQPAVLKAGDACAPVTHGFITKATVARFVAGH